MALRMALAAPSSVRSSASGYCFSPQMERTEAMCSSYPLSIHSSSLVSVACSAMNISTTGHHRRRDRVEQNDYSPSIARSRHLILTSCCNNAPTNSLAWFRVVAQEFFLSIFNESVPIGLLPRISFLFRIRTNSMPRLQMESCIKRWKRELWFWNPQTRFALSSRLLRKCKSGRSTTSSSCACMRSTH